MWDEDIEADDVPGYGPPYCELDDNAPEDEQDDSRELG